jgi:hypothetical protein
MFTEFSDRMHNDIDDFRDIPRNEFYKKCHLSYLFHTVYLYNVNIIYRYLKFIRYVLIDSLKKHLSLIILD